MVTTAATTSIPSNKKVVQQTNKHTNKTKLNKHTNTTKINKQANKQNKTNQSLTF
jgi:hypothetical protein